MRRATDEAWVLFGPMIGLKRSLARRAAMKNGFSVFPKKAGVNFPKSRKANSAFDRLVSLYVTGMVGSYDIGSLDAIGGSVRMVTKLDCRPGDRAPASATYVLCDDLGNPTGLTAEFQKGEPLAYAPRGFVWSLSTGGADEKVTKACRQVARTPL